MVYYSSIELGKYDKMLYAFNKIDCCGRGEG